MGAKETMSAAALPANALSQPRVLLSARTPMAAMGTAKTGPT